MHLTRIPLDEVFQVLERGSGVEPRQERLHFSAGLRAPCVPPEKLEGVGVKREVWGLGFCPHDQVLDRRKKMDGWRDFLGNKLLYYFIVFPTIIYHY